MEMVGKVFVTGVYGSGKTRFAARHARKHRLPLLDFDRIYRYDEHGKAADRILRELPERFVIDAIPIDTQGRWADFIAYESLHEVLVVCVYCPDRKRWLRRIQEKAYINDPTRGMRAALKLRYRIARLRLRPDFPLSIDADLHAKEYRRFFLENVPILSRFRNVRYFDSCREEFTSAEEMLVRVGSRTFPLEEHLASLGESHDWKYQDIEILGRIGYTESFRTWDGIRNLVDWKGKRVLDLGCFHGYFCFKVEDAGGIVKGLDRSRPVLDVAEMINGLRGGRVAFREWVAGGELPECDVILCLNVLHHFEDPEKALSRMRCRQAVFEINEGNRPLVEKHFDVLREVPSHRPNRRIFLCLRRDGPPAGTAAGRSG